MGFLDISQQKDAGHMMQEAGCKDTGCSIQDKF